MKLEISKEFAKALALLTFLAGAFWTWCYVAALVQGVVI